MLNHFLMFADEAAARVALSAYGQQSEQGWQWDDSRVIPDQRVVTSRAVWNLADPMAPVLVSPDQVLPGYFITVSLAEVNSTLRDLPGSRCRLIWNSDTGLLAYKADNFDVALLASAVIEPGQAGAVIDPLGRMQPPPDLVPIKAEAKATVSTAAETARHRYITAGSGKAMSYQQVAAEARTYVTTNGAGVYPFLQARVSSGRYASLAEAAASTIALEQAWASVGSEIDRIEDAAKLAIDAAATGEQVQAAAQVTWP